MTHEGRHDRETYDLMLALAVQQLDADLYDLIMASASPYTDALDIRASLGPMESGVAARLRADLQSPHSAVRIGAACAMALAPPEDAAELLTDTLARCPDDDPSAITVVRIANRLKCYRSAMLPQLRRMLDLPDPAAREAVLPYLAAVGDAEAQTEVGARFSAEASPMTDHCALKAAFSLSAHEQGDGPGLRRIAQFIDRRHSIYPTGLIAARLHQHGAMSGEALIELAYTARNLSGDSSAYLIEQVKGFDPGEACALAEFHFARSGSASSARQLLLLGGEPAIDQLLTRYLGENGHRARLVIARALRRHADRGILLDRLEVFARGNSVEMRVAAAELLGWLRDDVARAMVDRLNQDTIPEVADAALEADARQRSDDHARKLIGELPLADHLGRWARLHAIVDFADPYLLEFDPDGLALGEVTEPFGEAYAIAAEKMIKARKDKLEKEADRVDRDRRN